MDFTKFKGEGIPGTPLAEIFSIIINPYADECKLHGTIRVDDNEGTVEDLVDLGPKDPEHIYSDSSDRSLLLYNTKRAILASSHFTVYFDLKDLTDGDSEFVKDSFRWYARIDDDYDKVLVKTITGKRGSAVVYYTVHRLAIEAHIGVRLCKNRPGDRLDFKGTITARYKNRFDCDASESLKEHSRVMVFCGRLYESEGDLFPLERSVVTLPCYTSLVILVELRSTKGGEVLWNGEVEFAPKCIFNQRVDENIEGPYGSIRVSACAIDYARNSFARVEERKDRWRKMDVIIQWHSPKESDDESSA